MTQKKVPSIICTLHKHVGHFQNECRITQRKIFRNLARNPIQSNKNPNFGTNHKLQIAKY